MTTTDERTRQPDTMASSEPTLADQAAGLLPHLAGYVAHRTIGIGLRSGLIETLAQAPEGIRPSELARRLGLDPFYVSVWCRAAFGTGVCERDGTDLADATYRLAPHMATLLLDAASPAFLGGNFRVLEQHEIFGRFEERLGSGTRMWWDDCSADFIREVSGTGGPFYTRLIPGGLAQVPGLEERLHAGARILDTACGAGSGLLRLAQAYPDSAVVGVDGDAHSLDVAAARLEEAGLRHRVELVLSPLEELDLDDRFELVTNNISMHECRDADRVTENVARLLEPGGWFVISDFPFPDNDEGLRSVPGRIMSGIQFFEAQIDDQLQPRTAYDNLLSRHGFTDLGHVQLTPVHALTWGRAPR